ncbi:DUF1694 domain-containing protein [Lactobacillus delbrueckii subsp. bulgaricus]|nr:hypothetical protein [Lactobacillus delbrueckii subsp. bulgaricus]
MTENLTKRVENAANGITPQTRPDERRSFLGSLRERVFVRMTIKDCEDAKLTKLFMDHFADYKGYTILIKPLPAEKLPAPKKKGFLARFFGGNK